MHFVYKNRTGQPWDKPGHDDNGGRERRRRLAGAVPKREPDSRGTCSAMTTKEGVSADGDSPTLYSNANRTAEGLSQPRRNERMIANKRDIEPSEIPKIVIDFSPGLLSRLRPG